MEQVMVVDNQWLAPFFKDVQNGMARSGDAILAVIRARHLFIDRAQAETDFSRRQIIPYLILTHNGQYLVTTRLKKQNESRLHGKRSLGIGGHINPCPAGQDPFLYGLNRELNEEIGVSLAADPVYQGIIISDATEVSRVHLGLVYCAQTQTPLFEVREPEKMTAAWMTASEIQACYDQLEGWSQIVFDHLHITAQK